MEGIKLILLLAAVAGPGSRAQQPTPPPDIPDVDWGDLIHPPRTALKYRGGENTFLVTHGSKDFQAWYSVEDRRSFVFSVKACSSVYLMLSDSLGTTDFSIEIGLGVDHNTHSVIKYPWEMGTLFRQRTYNQLHCNEYRTFWIKWGLDVIDVGRGAVIGEGKFLNWLDKTGDYFVAVGLSSGDGNSAAWMIQENAGDYLDVYTPSVHRYTNIWKQVEKRRYFPFSVRACGHAHVLLAENLGNQEDNIYEIVIGGWDNTKSGIRRYVRGDLDVERDTPSILNCAKKLDFWVGWVNNTIEFGRGLEYGMHIVARYHNREANPPQIRYLALTTGFGADGWWFFDDTLSVTNVIKTPAADISTPANKYNSTWFESGGRKWLTFAVAACSQASVLLSDEPHVDVELAYEVIIGASGNTQTGIRYMVEIGWLASADTPDILECDHTRHFWISWLNNTIRVGRGFIYGQNEIVRYMHPADFKVRAYSIASPGDPAVWRFRDTNGERVKLYTPPRYTIDFWRTIPQHTSIFFRVKACSDAHVLLSPNIGIDREEMYYDLVISGWTNTQTQIRQVKNGVRSDESSPVETPGLLSCDHHIDLYLYWDGNKITFGRGTLTHHYPILEHQFADWDQPRAVSYSTWDGYPGDWDFSEDLGDQVMLYTNYYWLSEEKAKHHLTLLPLLHWTSFSVRACKDGQAQTDGGLVNLTMRQVDDVTQETSWTTYQILLGADENKKSRVIDPQGTVVTTADTPNILHCDDTRHFWISWGNDKIEVGHGTIHGYRSFMSADVASTAFEPSAIGFDTLGNGYGRWVLSENTATNAEFWTPNEYAYGYFWASIEHKEYLAFTTSACSDVHVAFSDRLTFDINAHAYEIVIGGWDNSRSRIVHNRVPRMDVATPSILHCNGTVPVSEFWITWHGGAIVVGQGFVIGARKFMHYSPVNPPTNLRMVSFSTGYGYEGNWLVPMLDAVLSPPVTEAPPRNGGGGSLSGGAIFGIVFGVMVLVSVGIIGTLFVLIRMGKLDPAKVPAATTISDMVTPQTDQHRIVEEDDNLDNPNYIAPEVDEVTA